MDTALITGVAGQDGSYLAELLLGRGYRVVGTLSSPDSNAWRIAHLRQQIEITILDGRDEDALIRVIEKYEPREIYNLAARASSAHLFDRPALTGDVNGLAVARILGAIRTVNPRIRFCQASSSEMFGRTLESPQDENTPFCPRNPYGAAKLYAHWMTVIARETHDLFACSAILFNHESPRRSTQFVTRKITHAVSEIHAGRAEPLELHDLDAKRDWGFAGDYVEGMWRMLQSPVAADYVLATGEAHSVGEFCEVAFARVGLDYRRYVTTTQSPRRPEGTVMVGNAGKARTDLGWSARVSFRELVHMMVDADVASTARSAAS